MNERPHGPYDAIAERFPPWAYKGVSAVLILFFVVATVFLIVGGVRIVVLNQGLTLGPNAGTISFGPVIRDDQLEKLTKFADSIVEIDGPRTCFRKPGWKAIDCFEEANFTAHFDGSTHGTDRALQDVK